jgi:hypothetical protein
VVTAELMEVDMFEIEVKSIPNDEKIVESIAFIAVVFGVIIPFNIYTESVSTKLRSV